jgi:hypothetical protein
LLLHLSIVLKWTTNTNFIITVEYWLWYLHLIDCVQQSNRAWEGQLAPGRRPSVVSPPVSINGSSSLDIPNFLKKRGHARYPR